MNGEARVDTIPACGLTDDSSIRGNSVRGKGHFVLGIGFSAYSTGAAIFALTV